MSYRSSSLIGGDPLYLDRPFLGSVLKISLIYDQQEKADRACFEDIKRRRLAPLHGRAARAAEAVFGLHRLAAIVTELDFTGRGRR